MRESAAALRDSETNVLDDSVRTSEVTALSPRQFDWVYERMRAHLALANEDKWGYGQLGEMEDIQIARYHSDRGGHYSWHPDASFANQYASASAGAAAGSTQQRFKGQNRLLSASVQLSLPEHYTGGDLQVGSQNATRELGAVVVFPSYQLHRVYPVLSGERYSLVVWLHGEDVGGDYWADAEQSYRGGTAEAEQLLASYSFARHNVLGALYGSSGRLAEAVPVYNKALDLNPTDSMSMNNMAMVLTRLRREAEAMPLFSRAIDLDPSGGGGGGSGPVWALRGRGAALHRAGRHEEAALDLEAALAASGSGGPADEITLIDLGLASFQLQRYNAALKYLTAAVETRRLSAGSVAAAHTTIAKLHEIAQKPTMAMGSANAAVNAARKAAQSSPDAVLEPLQLRGRLSREARGMRPRRWPTIGSYCRGSRGWVG